MRSEGACSGCAAHKLVNRITSAAHENTSAIGTGETRAPSRHWQWEGRVQDQVVKFLSRSGWTVTRIADTAKREVGKDIEAVDRMGHRLWVTVKGYPEKSASQQARHWFAETVYDLVRYRTEDDTVALAVGLPLHKTYKTLSTRIAWLKRELKFQFFWVREDGSVNAD